MKQLSIILPIYNVEEYLIRCFDSIYSQGIDEDVFLANLDEMVEQAFDDQCTGANPRYPLMSEIKDMYLNAYYGRHFTEKNKPNGTNA